MAKSQGALDGRELYPELKFQSLEEYAQEFYAAELVGGAGCGRDTSAI
jgi:hypothetical protein